MRSFKLLFIFCLLGSFLFTPLSFAKNLVINLIAVNASSEEQKEKDIKYYMPEELQPEDMLELGDLTLDYDVDKRSYFVHGEFLFEPQESRTFKLKVKDVWRIQKEEIDILKNQLEENLEILVDHESYPYAQRVCERFQERLDYIMAQQTQYSDNIGRRIEEYRAYKKELDKLRASIYSANFLKYQAKALDEVANIQKSIKFVVEVKNPSLTKGRTLVHKHYLPEEIRAEHILDKHGFDVRFDEEKGKTYLTKEEEFNAGEVKKYEFIIKDIWQFASVKLENLADRAAVVLGELEGSMYEESAKFLIDKVLTVIDLIKDSLDVEQPSIKSHIGIYRVNVKRFQKAVDNFKKVEQMLARVREKKLEDLESGKVKNILQKLKGLRGIAALSEALFKKQISVTMTWRIIMGAIIFVASFSTLHFIIWARRSKTMGEELGPKSGEEGIKEVPKPDTEEAEKAKAEGEAET